MDNITRIPLADRLRQAAVKQKTADYLIAYGLLMDTYFYSMGMLIGNSYSETMTPYIEKREQIPALMEFVADICKLPAEERDRLLYQVLVQPFAEIQRQKESENECLSQQL